MRVGRVGGPGQMVRAHSIARPPKIHGEVQKFLSQNFTPETISSLENNINTPAAKKFIQNFLKEAPKGNKSFGESIKKSFEAGQMPKPVLDALVNGLKQIKGNVKSISGQRVGPSKSVPKGALVDTTR